MCLSKVLIVKYELSQMSQFWSLRPSWIVLICNFKLSTCCGKWFLTELTLMIFLVFMNHIDVFLQISWLSEGISTKITSICNFFALHTALHIFKKRQIYFSGFFIYWLSLWSISTDFFWCHLSYWVLFWTSAKNSQFFPIATFSFPHFLVKNWKCCDGKKLSIFGGSSK